MKKKILSTLLALVLVLSFSVVTAVPAPVMAEEEGTNYTPFGTVLYIWGAETGTPNVMKWFYLGGDGDLWDGHQITIVNSQWPEFDGQWYLKNTAPERFTLWRDTALTEQVTTANTGLIGDWDNPAAYAIDGWVEFDPAIDSVGDPRETVGNYSHMWYDHSSGFGPNLEVKISNPVEHRFYDGWYLELVENGWTDLNGGWYLKWLGTSGGTYADRYELYYDAGFTQPGIPVAPDMFVAVGGELGYLSGPRGRFVLPDYLTAPVDEAASAYAADGGTGETETTNASIIADAAAGQSASVNLAEYTGTPIEGESVFGAVGSYIDVYTATPENLDEVEIRVNYDDTDMTDVQQLGLRMSYWNSEVGDWRQSSDQGVNIEDDYIWTRIGSDTTPDLNYLAGGPFGAGPPSVELDSEWYRTGEMVNVTIEDATQSGLIAAFAWSDTVHFEGKITFALTETDTGIFEGSFDLVSTTPGAGELLVNDGDVITVVYLGVGYTATVDDSPPTIRDLTPAHETIVTDAQPTISATLDDVGSGIDTEIVRMALDGAYVSATATESSVTYNPLADLAEGTWFVTIDVSDAVGNWAMPASWSFTVDTELPVITQEKATPPVVMPDEENTIVFTANVVDATSGIVSVTIDLSEITEGTLDMLDDGELPDVEEGDGIYSAEITTTLSEGNYDLLINAADAAGLAATATISLVVSSDIVPPVIESPQITYPIGAVSARVGDPFVVSAVVTDNGVLETVTLSATSDIFNIEDGATDSVAMTAEEGSDLYQTPSDLVVADGIDADSYELTITAEDDKGNTAPATLTLVVTTKLTGYNIALAEDWNLMSLPLIPDTPAIGTILASISENVDVIWGYDPVNSPADPWAMYVPGVIEDDLTQMVDGMGYWVYMTGSATLTISGIEMPEPPTTPPTYEVASGWNLMGVKDVALEGIAYDEYLTSISDDYSVIWGYDPETGYFNIHPLDEEAVLSPGQGYWLWMDVDGIIVPPR